MKILHLISGGDAGGARTHVLSLVGELARTEDVLLLTLGGGPLWEEARSRGLPCRKLDREPFSALRQVEELTGGRERALLHCHGSRADLTGALLKGRSSLPVIATIHSDHRLDYLGRPWARMSYGTLNALALRRMDALVCVSGAMAEVYRARGFRVVYSIHNGVDFSLSVPPPAREDRSAPLGAPVSADDVVIGTAARLEPVKDLPTLLRGFRLMGDDPRRKLVIAGTGSEEKRLRTISSRLGLEGRVFFPGWIEDMDRFYAALDIAVLTSRSETFPYALTMAARQALPVAATAVGGIPELVEDGVNGFLVPPGDAAALARALDRLAGDASLRRAMGRALREKGERCFTLEAMGRRQREIYEHILENRG